MNILYPCRVPAFLQLLFPKILCRKRRRGCGGMRRTCRESSRHNEKSSALVSWSCCNKVLQTGWLRQQTFISHCSGGSKLEIKVSVGLVSPEAFLLTMWMSNLSLCLHIVSAHGFPWCVLISYEDTYLTGLGPLQ